MSKKVKEIEQDIDQENTNKIYEEWLVECIRNRKNTTSGLVMVTSFEKLRAKRSKVKITPREASTLPEKKATTISNEVQPRTGTWS